MKNAGKACNNRLYRHIRTFEKIVKNYFVISEKCVILSHKTAEKCVTLFSAFDKLNQFKFFVFDSGLLKLMAGIDNSDILLENDY